MPRNAYAILLACLLALVATEQAIAANSLTLIDTCLCQLQNTKQPQKRSEAVTLSDSCPELSIALDNSSFAQLEPTLEDETTLGLLRDAQRSLRSMHTSPTNAHTLTLTNLHQILRQTYTPEKKSKPWENPFDKLLEWISNKIRDYFKQDNWITRNFHIENKISKSTIKGILNISILLLVVMVLFIIVNELRAASVFSLFQRRHRQRQQLREQDESNQDSSWVSLYDISKLPVNAQIPALFRYTLRQLINRKILPHRYNLTNQEFLNILHKSSPEVSKDFQSLVNSADRVVYGNKTIDASEVQRLLEQALRIEQLQVNVKQ